MDQRRQTRVVVHYPGSFRGEGAAGYGKVENISVGGCAFECNTDLHVGDFLHVEVHLPDQESPVKIEVAVVRWAKEQRFGVDFIQIAPEDEARLRRFIKTPKLVRWMKNFLSGGTDPSYP